MIWLQGNVGVSWFELLASSLRVGFNLNIQSAGQNESLGKDKWIVHVFMGLSLYRLAFHAVRQSRHSISNGYLAHQL
jgi:hypothetical protein